MSQIAPPVGVLYYDGFFPLDFLGDRDTVNSAGRGSHAIEVTHNGRVVRCPVGHYLIKDSDGDFHSCPPYIQKRDA